LEFSESATLFAKLRAGLATVRTPFAAMCADDDIVLPKGLDACLEFLQQNPDYSAAQGYHAQFGEDGDNVAFYDIAYFTPSLDHPDPIERITALMHRYQQVTWAVFRSEVVKEVIGHFSPCKTIMFNELLWSGIATMRGKVKRLPVLYCMRRIDKLHFMGHPFYALMESPQNFIQEYAPYRSIMANILASVSRFNPVQSERLLDTLHYYFVCKEIDTGPLSFFIHELVKNPDISIHDPQIDKSIRPNMPDLSSGWEKEVQYGTHRYRFFGKILRPEPSDEIHLALGFEDMLLADVRGYFER
jgi:hypothetical protein